MRSGELFPTANQSAMRKGGRGREGCVYNPNCTSAAGHCSVSGALLESARIRESSLNSHPGRIFSVVARFLCFLFRHESHQSRPLGEELLQGRVLHLGAESGHRPE